MFKTKDGFVLREIAGNWVVIPVGSRVVEFSSIISLNQSGSLLWKSLELGSEMDELLKKLMCQYEIDEDIARQDVSAFIQAMHEKGLLEKW